MQKAQSSPAEIRRAYFQMHLSIILWGITAVLGRGIQLTEGLLVWYRLIIATTSIFIFIKFMKMPLRVSRKDFGRLFGTGFLLMIHWVCFYGAIKYANVSITLSILSSITLFTALLEPLMTSKKFDKIEILYSLMAIAGICLIFYSNTNYTTGIILAIGAAFFGAFFNILNKSVVNKIESSVVSFYELMAGLVMLTLFLPLYIHVFNPVKLFPNTLDWVLLTILAIACTNVTIILSLNALKHLSAFTLNLAINLEPVYGIALAFLIYGENKNLHVGFFVGAGLIMLTVGLHSYFVNREPVALPD